MAHSAQDPGENSVPQLTLKVMLLNAENLFLLSDQKLVDEHLTTDEHKWQKLSTSVYDNKPLYKLKELTKIIAETNPDLILLAEVGGYESLANFNRLFLKDQYSPALVEGNSARNIDVGYLLKKNIGFYFDLVSNKNRSINFWYPHEREYLEATAPEKKHPGHRFSRDVAELHLFRQNKEKPFMLFLLAHLKSRLDPDGVDHNGYERRHAELKALLEIYQEFEQKFAGLVPIVVAGDFNGNASKRKTDSEFLAIYQTTQLQDVCDLAQLSDESCITYYQVGRNSKVEGKQIDYAFLSPAAARHLRKDTVNIYRYKDRFGAPLDPPSTLDAKGSLPSDHYPLVFLLENIPIID